MRAVFVVVIIVLVMLMVGWLKFSSPEGNPTIQVDSEKVKQDTAKMVEKSKEVIRNAADKIDEAEKEQASGPAPNE